METVVETVVDAAVVETVVDPTVVDNVVEGAAVVVVVVVPPSVVDVSVQGTLALQSQILRLELKRWPSAHNCIGSFPWKQLKYPLQSRLPTMPTGAAYKPVFPWQNSDGSVDELLVVAGDVVVPCPVVLGVVVLGATVVLGETVVITSQSTLSFQSQFLVAGLKRKPEPHSCMASLPCQQL